MQTENPLPKRVRSIEHVWIPMSDGVRLAARIWLPEDAASEPVPAILEYIPYRRRDHTRARDTEVHGWFAAHGYASVRVDIRGSGDSEGLLEDEYLERELQDGEEIIAWLAEQEWCSGRVGMIGISWGGFNGLQIAARRPPALGAVITIAFTDDRYADDVHYMGGCLLGDNLSWASTMFAYNSCPPDPAIVGEGWREQWLGRLEDNGPWLDTWLTHQHRDAYWKHGSVCEDYADVQVPVFAASGWADGYSNAVFRVLANLNVPRLGLVGPWSHKYPNLGEPGPAIGFLQEAKRWWDQWLKDEDTGIMEEPMLRAWMQESVPPTTRYAVRPGRWVGEPAWPSPAIRNRVWRLEASRCLVAGEAAEPGEGMSIQSPLSVGLFAGKWCSYQSAPDLPHDQREEDGGALTFDSEPLDETIELLGGPVVDLELSADQPVAMVAVRLSDVRTDGSATRLTYGLLNLTHRDGHEHPKPLVPGERYHVQVRLNEIAQSLPAGHRLRVSISTSYWPLAWPAPRPVTLTVVPGHSTLTVPVRPPTPEDERISFEPPVGAEPLEVRRLEAEHHNWRVIRDLASDESTLEVIKDEGVVYIPEVDLEVQDVTNEWYSAVANEFETVRGRTHAVRGFRREGWDVRTETHTLLTSDETHFILQADLDAYEDGKRIFCRTWRRRIPRRLV